MRVKVLLMFAVSLVGELLGESAESVKSKRGILNGYYGNIYHYIDALPMSSNFYNPIYIPTIQRYREPTKIVNHGSSYLPQSTQDTAYTQILQAPQPSQGVVTPIQHSTYIHHTPFYPSIPIHTPAATGRMQQSTNAKFYQPQNYPLQHPLQKQMNYQQAAFIPSPQVQLTPNGYNSNLNGFIPAKHPPQTEHINMKVQHIVMPAKEVPVPPSPPKEEVKQESAEEEEEEDSKEQVKEQEDDEEEETAERYREEDDEDEEEERPKYINYSFESNSMNKKKKTSEDDDEEDNAGYKTHEEIDEGEDASEESSSLSYKKKTPKNFSKQEKKAPINKSRPIKSNYERYTFSRGKDGKPKIDGIQGKPSEKVPVTVQKIFKEKWYITRENTK